MTELGLWLLGLAALPLAVVLASLSGLGLERLRDLAVACAAGLVALASLAVFVPAVGEASIPWPLADRLPWAPLWGPSVARTNQLVDVLIPMVAGLWLVTVTVTPRSRLDRAGIRRTALATMITTAAFSTSSPLLLAVAWTTSLIPFWFANATPQRRRAQRVAAYYLGASTLLFVAGVALTTIRDVEVLGRSVGVLSLIAAALVRKGVFPFHAWVPEVFEHGSLGAAVLVTTPQLGSYVTIVLIVPRAGPELLHVVATLALITTVYGAALALIQRDARRGLGYLFVSQSALVMAGLDCASEHALAGALIVWVSSALAFAGIARCVLVLEVRRGRLDLSKFHGGHQRMPALAAAFLVFGLACTGFPGTLGFVGEELLLDGAVETFPVLGLSVVGAGALTGLAVLRMYVSLFCGRVDAGPSLPVLRREHVTFAALSMVLIAAGLSPGPLVRSRLATAREVRAQRVGAAADDASSSPAPEPSLRPP